jgi:hypothetical protein
MIDYLALVYLLEREKYQDEKWYWKKELTYVTALVPSETACLASSPGNKRRTAV